MRRLLTFSFLAVLILVLAGCGDGPEEILYLDKECPAQAAPGGAAQAGTLDPALKPDSYVAVVPQALRRGYTEHVSVSLFNGDRPASGNVRVSLLDGGRVAQSVAAAVSGTANILLPVPRDGPNHYEVAVAVAGVPDERRAYVRVEDGLLLFVETDKPLYQPGQTIHVRLMTLDAALKPWPSAATLELQDAKGIKVYRKEVETGDYGMATLDVPLSTEPNLGVWKLTALAGDRQTQLDVRVERYALPKYEVSITTARDWILASDPIMGTVAGQYAFGKPVVGEVEIVASRYVGRWEEFARFSAPIDGEAAFELPPAQYVAGVPQAGGQGNVTLDVTVRERSTGYEQKTSKLLTVTEAAATLTLIPESRTLKPCLPLSYLIVAQEPDGTPVDGTVTMTLEYVNQAFQTASTERIEVALENGTAIARVTAPAYAAAVTVHAQMGRAYASLNLQAGHSPSDSFIHVEQVTQGEIAVGDTAQFRVHATREARNFYYEVLSRGAVVFTDVSRGPDIAFTATALMAPSARLLVYQILPNNEIAADYVPFGVAGGYGHDVDVGFSREEVRPGDAVDVRVQTQGEARVGLVAVDRSVFILAENRLNLQQIFAELERLYQQPQAELHDINISYTIEARGASETFAAAGTVVLTNKDVPAGRSLQRPQERSFVVAAAAAEEAEAPRAEMAEAKADPGPPENLAEVQRVRQFFPETWIWRDVYTDANGRAVLSVEAPDSITTWALRAVGISKEHGLGIGESELRVFQPFFLTVDLPVSAIRGEELPVKIALFNYRQTAQEFFVEIEESEWFALLDEPLQTVTVEANDIGGVEFMIRPTGLGRNPIKITARSAETADAVIKELLVEPEGIGVEHVDNRLLSGGQRHEFLPHLPPDAIAGSGRAYVALSGNLMTQSIAGLDQLLQMPFGCGEQNMILFAPNVYVTRYLRETGQLKPEIMAKAEHLMLVGYQRELTYMRDDGSFSAFGNSDTEGSLWLTAFVLKTFAESREIIYIDPQVLDRAAAWIERHQLADGSFENVGFLHHQELLGGLQGRDALTAYVAIALLEAGRDFGAARAMQYLESRLEGIQDPYTMAIAAYALALADSALAAEAHARLMAMANEDADGALYWGGGHGAHTAAIETTGYALLALLANNDDFNASQAAKWLVGQRNALGGYGSTQDTVVSLQALAAHSARVATNVEMTVVLQSGDWRKEVALTPENADVMQIVQVPLGNPVTVTAMGRGTAIAQTVLRYNVPERETEVPDVFAITVDYGTERVAVDDRITVHTSVTFNPPDGIEAGMVVLDVAVPTGFEPVRETVAALVEEYAIFKRFEIAGRKAILYIDNMRAGETLTFAFQARAKYPVRAKAVVSQAYSYYRPEQRGETLGGALTVTE